MAASGKQVRIMSLGEIVTPNMAAGIASFAQLIATKKSLEVAAAMPAVGKTLQECMPIIETFKQGQIFEDDFDAAIIAAFKKNTDVTITVDELNQAWSTMNPAYEDFQKHLQDAIAYNQQPDHELVLISYTNPKDMDALKNELLKNKVACQLKDDVLCGIADITLYTTYATQTSKAQLIEQVIKGLYNGTTPGSALASSMSAVLGTPTEKQKPKVKYVRGVNNITDLILKDDLDETNRQLAVKTDRFMVETVIWMKKDSSLLDVLNDEAPAARSIDAIRL